MSDSTTSLRLQQLGYQPDDSNLAALGSEIGPLYVITGTCPESAGGFCQHAFFFYDNRYLGTDTSTLGVSLVSIKWTTSDVAALSYPLYAPSDAHCCPSGGARLVRFEWNESALVPLDPLPADPNSTTGNSGNTGNTGNT
jgi:hypothetical protein